MKIIVCPNCGYQSLKEFDGYFKCDNCGTKLTMGGPASYAPSSSSNFASSASTPSAPTDDSILEFHINPHGAHLVGVKKPIDKIVLPTHVGPDRIPVTRIEMGAFKNAGSMLETVVIPDTVEVVERFAFEKCPKLRYVRLPSTLKEISEGTFAGCHSLREIEIPNTVRSIGQYAFAECTSLSSIILPEGVYEIGHYAFGESGIVEMTLPSSLRLLGSCFQTCYSLKRVRILSPSFELTEDRYYFYSCPILEQIIIKKGAKADLKIWRKDPILKKKIIEAKDPASYL